MTILDKILTQTQKDLEVRKKNTPIEVLREQSQSVQARRSMVESLTDDSEVAFKVISEVKKASPSKGLIREDFDPLKIAQAYSDNGASGISVLTDEPFFQGSLEYLQQISEQVTTPLLRKDFILDPYQVYEAKLNGASALLLIVAALDDATLEELHTLSYEVGVEVLVEVHDQEEMTRAKAISPKLIGVNNRNLKTFEVSLETTRTLLDQRPDDAVFISESGFSTREELEKLTEWGVDAFLIGESLMRAEDPGRALRQLVGKDLA